MKANQIFDEIAQAIQGANACGHEMHRLDEANREQLELLESNLRKILDFPKVVEAPEAAKLLRRIERLRELRNMSEYGSLMLEIERSMDGIWKRLP